nr:immunoglobulin light chain junction region [Macaca mulatta]
CQQGSGIPFTF